MNVSAMINNSYAQYFSRRAKVDGKTDEAASFQTNMTNASKRTGSAAGVSGSCKPERVSAVEEFKRRNPEHAAHVDKQVCLGKQVLSRNGAQNVDRDSMSMAEYKQFFTELMNSIPYDWSQQNDVNVWSISEDGWEQMKSDRDYEAWVLGYTSEDRAVNIPWAAMPGYSPQFHSEKFGASIEEHIGQGFPMNSPTDKTSGHGNESWWEKRIRRMRERAEEQEELARRLAKHRQIARSIQRNCDGDTDTAQALTYYESNFSIFSDFINL